MSDRSHIAEVLKEAREERGLSVELAATESGIPLRYVQLLEGESTAVGIPDEFYLIPFFRRYAAFVGLEVDALLPEFLGQVQQVRAGPAGPGLTPSGRPFAFSIDSLWRPGAVVLAVALATFLLVRNSPEPVAVAADPGNAASATVATGSNTIEAPPDAAAPAPANANPARLARRVEAPRAEAPVVTVSAETAAAAANPPAGETATQIAPSETEPDPAQAGARELRIVATETVWLEIGRDDGPGQEYWLEPGDTRTLRAHDSFSLKVGNAGGVDLAFDGRTLPPLGASGQVVRVRLPDPIAHASGG